MTQYVLKVSVVIPCRNEEAGLCPLVDTVHAALVPLGFSYELIISDDASTDNSWEILKRIAQADARVRVQRFRSRCGESAASWAGIQVARGRYIVTMDADLQNDPADLPRFLEALEHFDCVCGSRLASRHEGDSPVRSLSSRVANWVRNKILAENISDSGCTYRAFRSDCVSQIRFFRGAHRFLPALFRMQGFTVTEIPIRHNPRSHGLSRYNMRSRLFNSLTDLLGVWWMKSRRVSYEIIETVN